MVTFVTEIMNENSKVFFIINKFSGPVYRPAVEHLISATCNRLKLEYAIEFTQGRGHATELAHHAIAQGIGKVFAVGGDGTVNEVAKALLHTPVAMGILPTGSGNGLARHLKIPMKFSNAVNLIHSARHIAMDAFSVNGNLSVNVSGIGFDAHVAGLFGKNGKRGLMEYGKLAIKEFLRFQEFPVDGVLDGQVIKRKSFILAIANSSQFGNNARISPLASVCDQLIDICFVKKVPLVQAAGFAQKMFSGRLNRSAFVEILQGKNLRIGFDQPMPYHVDGEPMPAASQFDITMLPRSLNMIVPGNINTNL